VLLVGRFDTAQGVLQGVAYVGRRLAHIFPMTVFGDGKTVLIGKVFAVGLDRILVLLVPDIANPLVEQQRQNVALPICAVERAAAQNIGSLPEMTFEGGDVGLWRHDVGPTGYSPGCNFAIPNSIASFYPLSFLPKITSWQAIHQIPDRQRICFDVVKKACNLFIRYPFCALIGPKLPDFGTFSHHDYTQDQLS
jgi:hypothetical protein